MISRETVAEALFEKFGMPSLASSESMLVREAGEEAHTLTIRNSISGDIEAMVTSSSVPSTIPEGKFQICHFGFGPRGCHSNIKASLLWGV